MTTRRVALPAIIAFSAWMFLTGCSKEPNAAPQKKAESASTAASTGEANVAPSKEAILRDVRRMVDAMSTSDMDTIFELTDPRLWKMVPDPEAAKAKMKLESQAMKKQGYEFSGFEIGEPGEFTQGGSELFVVVPYRMELNFPQGRFVQDTCVVGISGDKGKSWKYLNGDISRKDILRVVPNLPNTLKIPAHQPIIPKGS